MKDFIMIKWIFLLLTLNPELSHSADLELNGILATEKFVEHKDHSSMGSWLGVNLSYGPFDQLRKSVEKTIKYKLNSRGEAHITVITPPEFDKILKKSP